MRQLINQMKTINMHYYMLEKGMSNAGFILMRLQEEYNAKEKVLCVFF